MRVHRLTACLFVDDPAAAASFYVGHLGFRPDLVSEYVVKLGHDEPAIELCFLPSTSEFAPPGVPSGERGVLLALEVDDAAAELERLRSAGVPITAPLTDDEWGERSFQFADPNGLTVQLVQWLKPRPKAAR